jgi:hypothetical protein
MPRIFAVVMAIVLSSNIAQAQTNDAEEPWANTISLDSLTRLREDSVFTLAKQMCKRKFSKDDKKTVHEYARSGYIASQTLSELSCGKGLHVGMSAYDFYFFLRLWPLGGHVNNTTTASGTSSQWVINRRTVGSSESPLYVYLEDGKVTAIQD